ncbi:hypothetical protein JXB41_00165 [Candidatus Woesearchaeota archaeon]|nr:hypothetical protein [Candidatus Woesearchaeota archaeon]
MKILLLTKKSKYCKIVQDCIKNKIPNTEIFEGESGDPLPNIEWEGDYIISYLSPWIVPKELLNKAKFSINFHPASPKYPGIGCYNFAIYNQEKEFGATCHYMLEKVDSGKIVKTIKFQMQDTDTVQSLKERTMDYMLTLFYDILKFIEKEKPLPRSDEKWLRRPYTRKDLQELCKLSLDMDENEIKRRLKATYFPNARDLPYLEVYGNKFIFKGDNENGQ